MATATYSLLVDWDNDGTFISAGEDVTARTLHVEFSRGRDVDSQPTGRSVAGSLQAVLNNESGAYNSYNATGTLYGSLLPGRLIRLVGSGTQTMWQGYIDRITPLPSVKGLNTARLEAIGPLGFLNQKEVSLNTYANIDTGSAVDLVLSEAGWQTGTAYRDVDAGKTTMVRFWTDRKRTIEALREIEETEAGFVRESAAGKIVFENRHRRLTSPYTTSQVTFTDDPSGTLVLQGMTQEDPLPFIFTEFVSMVEPYTLGSTGTLWVLNQTGTLSPSIAPNGGTRVFVARYPGPTASADHIGVDSWVTPSATADWNVTTDQQGTGTNLNGSCTVSATSYQNELRVVLTNNAAMLVGTGSAFTLGSTTVTPDKTLYGSLDELRVFTIARNSEQIAKHRSRNIYAQEGLALYYKFNEGRGTAIRDHSQSRANGTLYPAANTPIWNAGLVTPNTPPTVEAIFDYQKRGGVIV